MATSKKPARSAAAAPRPVTPDPPRVSQDEPDLRVPILEESLGIDKETVDRGGYRITKRVGTRQQLVDELLRTQRVEIERRHINTAIADDAIPRIRHEGNTLIVPVIEEVLITVKRLVLVEEVRITRLEQAERKPRTVTLRKEHVEVERLGAEESSAIKSFTTACPTRQGIRAPSGALRGATMSSVLIGMFDSQMEAAHARGELITAGFAEDAVTLIGGTGPSSTAPATATATTGATHHKGAIARFFDELFGKSDDDDPVRSGYTETYNEAFRRGSYGVSVTTTDAAEVDKAERILNDAGAVDIDEKAEAWRKEGWTGGATPVAGAAAAETGGTRKLQEVEEELKIGKRAVAKGGVRIFTRMTEEPVSETVRLREEHAQVKRTAVDRPATDDDFAAFKEGSIEVRETSEEPVVSKTARVTGEVEVSKTATERDETVHDTVRKTKVDVEQLEGVSGERDEQTVAGGNVTRDPITRTAGAHPVGTGVGAAAGGVAAGAAAGSVAGPVGTATGAVVGAVAGGMAGKEVAEKVDPATGKSRTKKPV